MGYLKVLSICLVCLRLFALTVKYTLHPLSVEDVIEQCQTKIDRLGGHYFLTIEPNGCKSHAICMLALVWPYSYVHINALSKEDALRWKEETSPYGSVLYIEFTSETPRLLTLVDAGDTSKGLHPVRVRGQHVAAFCSGPPTTGYPDHCGSGVFGRMFTNYAVFDSSVTPGPNCLRFKLTGGKLGEPSPYHPHPF